VLKIAVCVLMILVGILFLINPVLTGLHPVVTTSSAQASIPGPQLIPKTRLCRLRHGSSPQRPRH
jgi:hypothetical protein